MPDFIVHYKKPRGRTQKHVMVWAARNPVFASKRAARMATVRDWLAAGFLEYGITQLPIVPRRRVP